jgi:hypothetical protein
MEQSEEGLVAGLSDAQRKAEALFAEIEAQSLIRPGAMESEINESVCACREQVRNLALLAQAHRARRGEPAAQS